MVEGFAGTLDDRRLALLSFGNAMESKEEFSQQHGSMSILLQKLFHEARAGWCWLRRTDGHHF